MSKSTAQYWNVLAASNACAWETIDDIDGMMEQLNL